MGCGGEPAFALRALVDLPGSRSGRLKQVSDGDKIGSTERSCTARCPALVAVVSFAPTEIVGVHCASPNPFCGRLADCFVQSTSRSRSIALGAGCARARYVYPQSAAPPELTASARERAGLKPEARACTAPTHSLCRSGGGSV